MADDVQVKFTADISELQNRLKSLESSFSNIEGKAASTSKKTSDSFKEAGQGISSSLNGIATGIAAAFSVNAVIAFGKASIDAFAKAEKQTAQLQFAVEKVAKLSSSVFQELIKQSKELSKVSFFDDEDIQTAQKLFIQIGLNASEVKKLTPLVLDLAAAQGTTLDEAAQKAVGAINGVTKGLKDVGANFENTGTKVGNLNALMGANGLQKIQGAASDALNTTSGALEQQQVRFENLQETIGQKLAPKLLQLKVSLLDLFENVLSKIIVDTPAQKLAAETDAILNQMRADTFTSVEILKKGLDDAQTARYFAEQKRKEFNGQTINSVEKREALETAQSILVTAQAREAAYKKIIEERISGVNKEEQNANSISKQDAEKAAADKLEIDKKAAEKRFDEATKEREKLQTLFNTPITPIDGQPKGADTSNIKTSLNLFPVTPEESKKIKDAELANILDYVNSAQDLLGSLYDFIAAGNQAQLDSLNERRDKSVELLDSEAAALEKKNERGAISDRQYQIQKDALEEKRRLNQKKFDAEEKKLKQKQAEQEKLLAIFNTIVNTAVAVAKALDKGPIYAALVGAAGALQLATILSTPIPKFKEGKKFVDEKNAPAGRDTILSWLDRGERVVTRENNAKHWDKYEAIESGNFNKYVEKFFVQPQLQLAKKQFEESRRKEFAKDVTSMFINSGLTATEADRIRRKGMEIKNTNELAEAIAEKIVDKLPKQYGKLY